MIRDKITKPIIKIYLCLSMAYTIYGKGITPVLIALE
jgi:hypothetical protein